MSTIGKEIRLKRLIPEDDGLYFGLTIDHAMARGVLPGIYNVEDTIKKLMVGKPDGITMHKGIAEHCFSDYAGLVPLVLKCTTFSPFHPGEDVVVSDVEEGIRMGADAISVGCIVGGDNQSSQINTLGTFSKIANEMGMPIMTHIYPRGNLIPKEERYDWKNILYATRAAAELGVDLIKTDYPGDPESFAKVVQGTPAKVFIAGGFNTDTVQEYLQMTRDIIDAGGMGVTYGRYVFSYKDPTSLVIVLRKIIHEKYSVKEAMELLEHLINEREVAHV